LTYLAACDSMLRRLVRTTLGLLAATALFLLTLELLLAAWPTLLPPRLGNHAYSKYGSFPGGIYFYEPESKLHFMRSNFETRTYFNGYTWTHRTDGLGFRNPPELTDRSLLLLGDSLIYGHGVEERDSVAQRLRTEFSRPAYSMARQGDCLLQSYVLLRLDLEALDPEAVVLFVFLNDFADAALYRTAAEMEAPPEISWDYDALQERLAVREAHGDLSPGRLLLGLRSVRLLRGAWRDLTPVSLISNAEAAEEEPAAQPDFIEALLDSETFTRTSRYYRKLLEDLAPRLEHQGVSLHLVHLNLSSQFTGRGDRARLRLDRFLRQVTGDLGIAFATTEATFANCTDCFLPGDGHLSAAGHQRLAGFVDAMLSASDAKGPDAPSD
jgi:hypothetical protein